MSRWKVRRRGEGHVFIRRVERRDADRANPQFDRTGELTAGCEASSMKRHHRAAFYRDDAGLDAVDPRLLLRAHGTGRKKKSAKDEQVATQRRLPEYAATDYLSCPPASEQKSPTAD